MTFTRATLFAAMLGTVVAAAQAGDEPRDLATLFPRQAPIVVEGGGVARLVVPPEVLSACRADLSDLRVLDLQGREVAYLVDSGLAPDLALEAVESRTPEVLAVEKRRIDREPGPSLWRESYELAPVEGAPAAGRWALVFEARRRSFVREVDVAEVAGSGTRTELVAGASVFRLQDPLRERLEIELPETAGGRLVVTLTGEGGPHLEPVIRLQSSRLLRLGEQATVPLEELGRRSSDGRTEIELARPHGVVPDLLVVDTSTPAFNRRVEVWDEGPGASDDMLGADVLYRLPARTVVEETALSLARARGDRLRVIITDNDSRPLDDVRVAAVVRRPALLFVLPEAPSPAASGVLLFGGGRAFRPSYDLAALLGTGDGPVEDVTAALVDPSRFAAARLGPVAVNPEFDAAPALAFAHRPGAVLDRSPFSHRRPLRVDPSPEGLSKLVLQPEDTAVMRPDLADLRIVDPESRQWAYLLEERASTQTRALPVAERRTEAGVSSYALSLPVAPVVLDRIVIDVALPYFDRAFELRAAREEGRPAETTLARGRLVRRIGDPRPLTVAVPSAAIHSLELRIEDGDDAPLALENVEARLPLAEVYVAAPAGEYELLLGDPDGSSPRYELARIRGIVLAVRSSEVEAGPLESNPGYVPGSRLFGRRGLARLALWASVAVMVVLLTVLTLRLARSER